MSRNSRLKKIYISDTSCQCFKPKAGVALNPTKGKVKSKLQVKLERIFAQTTTYKRKIQE